MSSNDSQVVQRIREWASQRQEVWEREGNVAAYKHVINLGERNSGASSYNFPVSLNFTKILSLLPKTQNAYFKKLEKGQQQIRIRGYYMGFCGRKWKFSWQNIHLCIWLNEIAVFLAFILFIVFFLLFHFHHYFALCKCSIRKQTSSARRVFGVICKPEMLQTQSLWDLWESHVSLGLCSHLGCVPFWRIWVFFWKTLNGLKCCRSRVDF